MPDDLPARKQMEYFGDRDPDVDQSHTAHRPAQVTVVPSLAQQGSKIVFSPPIRPGINKEKEAQLGAENDQQNGRKAAEPERRGRLWLNFRNLADICLTQAVANISIWRLPGRGL